MTQMFAQAAQTGLIEVNGMCVSEESLLCRGRGNIAGAAVPDRFSGDMIL